MVVISLLPTVLLATAAFADPSAATLAFTRHKSRLFQSAQDNIIPTDGVPKVLYGPTGQVLVGTNPSRGFSLLALSKHPKPKGLTVWVGIDGFTCPTAILQTGIYITYSKVVTKYFAWYEWYPADSINFILSINAGDDIQTSVKATSNTTGIAKVENLTTDKVVEVYVNSTYALCGQNAEWIVEDYSTDKGVEHFTNFGTLKFDLAYATTPNEDMFTPEGANIRQNNKTLTVTERFLQTEITYIA